MHIQQRKPTEAHSRLVEAAITEAAAAKGVEGRVCGEGCTIRCPQCGATGCGCKCSAQCPDAAWALSSDPVCHPIEPAIVPLVFEMKRLGLFAPCWSCEGHTRADGTLLKVPRVWFTCESMVHVRLLASGLTHLQACGRLHTPWQVVVTFSDAHNPEATFSLEPAPAPDRALTLAALREDTLAIARALPNLMRQEAQKLQSATATPR